MKKLISLLLLLIYKMPLLAQAPINSWPDEYTYPQINGTDINGVKPLTTDPRKTVWLVPPYNPDFKRNRFPWFSEQIPNSGINPFYQYKFRYKYPATIQVGEIKSPFAANDALPYTSPLRFSTDNNNAGNVSPDYLPEDGWELVKQSMGYYKNDNSGIPKDGGVSELDPDPKMIPYVLLYNKFSGNLRILAFGGHLWGTSPEGNIAVNMVLNQQISGPTKNFSGLLNAYGETYTPLDQKTKVEFVQSLAVYPGSVGFLWADFQMSYDPCVCFYESWVTFDFVQIQTYSIQGFSQSISLDGDINANEVASYLAAVWKANLLSPVLNNGMLNYKNGANLEEELKASINSNSNYIKKDKMLKYVKLLGQTMGEVSEGLGAKAKEPKSQAIAKGLKYGGKGIKFFARSLETPMSKATKTAGAFKGTVSRTTNPLIVKADLATPGSWDVKNRSGEYFPDPDYPIYNETMGTIAFLTTPKVYYDFKYQRSLCNIAYMTNAGYVQYDFKFDPNSLLYKFNPILDVKSYEIEVALEVSYSLVFTAYDHGGNVKVIADPGKVNSKNIENYEVVTAEAANFIEDFPLVFRKRFLGNTPYVNLNCSSNLRCQISLEDFITCRSKKEFLKIHFVRLNVIVKGISNKLDRNGKNIHFVQKFTLPTEFITLNGLSDTQYISNLSPFNGNGGIPFDLTIGNRTFNTNDRFDKIYAHETITLNGIVTNNQVENGQKKSVTFAAGQEFIEVLPGYETRGTSNIILEISSPYTNNCLPNSSVAEQSNAFVTSFCKKQNPTIKYGANEAFSRFAVDNSPTLPSISSATTLGFPIPNPTNGECSLSFDLAEEGGYEMYMSNTLGVRVKKLEHSDFAKTGNYKVQFQTGDLEAGVYYITLAANGFRQARKLVVVK